MKGYLFSSLCVRKHGASEKRYPFILKNRGTIIRGKNTCKEGREIDTKKIILWRYRIGIRKMSTCNIREEYAEIRNLIYSRDAYW